MSTQALCPNCASKNIVSDEDSRVCSACGWVIEDDFLVHENPSLGHWLQNCDDGSQALLYNGGIHAQIIQGAAGTGSRQRRERAMLEIFKSAISQLSLSVSEKEQMIHLQRRVFDFLSQGRQADLVEREASRGVELEATESEEERKYRKRAERAARQRYLNHHSINSTPRPLAGAIIYAVCRQNGRPISIGNVAMAIGANTYAVGKAFTQIQRHMGLTLRTIDATHYLLPAIATLGLSEAERTKLTDQSTRMLSLFGISAGFTEGRNKSGIAMGSIMLSAEIIGIKIPISKLVRPDVKQSAIKERQKELKTFMINYAADALPYPAGTINRMNIKHYAEEILVTMERVKSSMEREVLEELERSEAFRELAKQDDSAQASSSTSPGASLNWEHLQKEKLLGCTLNPPAFIQAEEVRQRRRIKLEKAKQRLATTLAKSPMTTGLLQKTDIPIDIKKESKMESTGSSACKTRVAARKRKREGFETEERQQEEQTEEIDEEDLKIERCLLLGVDESLIVGGNFEVLNDPMPPSTSQNSEELDDNDISESELKNYILNEDERRNLCPLKRALMQ